MNFKNGERLYKKPVYVFKGTYSLKESKMRFDVKWYINKSIYDILNKYL